MFPSTVVFIYLRKGTSWTLRRTPCMSPELLIGTCNHTGWFVVRGNAYRTELQQGKGEGLFTNLLHPLQLRFCNDAADIITTWDGTFVVACDGFNLTQVMSPLYFFTANIAGPGCTQREGTVGLLQQL